MKKIIPTLLGISCLLIGSISQTLATVEIIQRRFVAAEHVDEFIKRETTYWSEVARQAIEDGKMYGWSLWRRVDGMDLDKSHNFIFINSFVEPEGLDKANEIWDFKKIFPDLNTDEVSTGDISTIQDVLYYERIAFSFKEQPEFIRINYAKTTNVGDYIELEQVEWFPFVQERMDSGKTNVVSWTLSQMVMPRGQDIGHEAISIDGFNTLSDSIFTYYGGDVPFPDMVALGAVHHKAEVHVYQLIKAVARSEFEY